MLARLILSLIKINLKNNYYNIISVLMEFVSIIVSLIIYWYTSKAFTINISNSFSEYKTDYFHFLLIGEIFMGIPLLLLTNFAKKTKMFILDGTFETFLALPIHPLKPLTILTLTDVVREIIHVVITLICASLFFTLNINLINIFYCGLLFLLTIITFISLGIIVTALLLLFGRGENLIGYFTTITAVLSGAFFPIEVFPKTIVNILNFLSPYTLFLQTIREVSSNAFLNISTVQIATLIAWNLMIIPALYLYNYSVKIYRKNGGLVIFTY